MYELKFPEYYEKLAEQAIKKGYIDYFQTRLIKTDLSKDYDDPPVCITETMVMVVLKK